MPVEVLGPAHSEVLLHGPEGLVRRRLRIPAAESLRTEVPPGGWVTLVRRTPAESDVYEAFDTIVDVQLNDVIDLRRPERTFTFEIPALEGAVAYRALVRCEGRRPYEAGARTYKAGGTVELTTRCPRERVRAVDVYALDSCESDCVNALPFAHLILRGGDGALSTGTWSTTFETARIEVDERVARSVFCFQSRPAGDPYGARPVPGSPGLVECRFFPDGSEPSVYAVILYLEDRQRVWRGGVAELPKAIGARDFPPPLGPVDLFSDKGGDRITWTAPPALEPSYHVFQGSWSVREGRGTRYTDWTVVLPPSRSEFFAPAEGPFGTLGTMLDPTVRVVAGAGTWEEVRNSPFIELPQPLDTASAR